MADRAVGRDAARGHLIGPRREPVEQRPGVLRVPACDGDLGVADHSGEPSRVERKIEVGGRELLQQATGVVDAAGFDMGHSQRRSDRSGDLGSVGGHLLDEWDQLAAGAALEAHRPELRAEEEGGVGLAAVGADLECLGGQLFGLFGVPGDLRSQGTRVAVHPVQGRLIELLGERPDDLQAAVHLVDVPGAGGSAVRACQAAQNSRTGSPTRSARTQGVGRPGQRLFEQWRHAERVRRRG